MSNEPRRKNLGRGLAALFGEEGEETSGESAASRETRRLPIEFLEASPLQPRRNFDDEALDSLAQSMRTSGMLQPILVRPHRSREGYYEIVAGERRWRAAQRARLHEVPVVVRELDDGETLEIAIVENVQRQDLNAIEEAEGYRRLIEDFGHGQEEVASAVGKSRSHVANSLRLLNLPAAVQDLVRDGALTAGQVRPLIGLKDAESLAREIAQKGLSAREAEALSKRARTGTKTSKKPASTHQKDADTLALERELSASLGLKARIEHQSGERGRLIVDYRTLAQLDDLIARLSRDRDDD